MNIFEIINKAIEANPLSTLIYFIIGAAIWLIGGNVVIALHYRRMKKTMWTGAKPFAFPIKDFNGREWFCFSIIALIGFLFMLLALYSAH